MNRYRKDKCGTDNRFINSSDADEIFWYKENVKKARWKTLNRYIWRYKSWRA